MRATSLVQRKREKSKEIKREEKFRVARYCIGERAAAVQNERRLTAGSLHAVNFLRMVAAHAHHARLRTINKGNTAFLFIE